MVKGGLRRGCYLSTDEWSPIMESGDFLKGAIQVLLSFFQEIGHPAPS